MEYQKIANLLDNEVALSALNKSSKFRIGNWVQINDDIRGTYAPNTLLNKLDLKQSY